MSTLPISKQVIVDVFIFTLVFIPLLLLHYLGRPVVTGFWCRDQDLSYPYKQDTVSMPLLLLASLGGPLFMISVVECIRATSRSRTFRQFRVGVMSLCRAYGVFLFGIVVTCIFTDALKLYVGRLRPHFFDTCKPNLTSINCTSDLGHNRFVEVYECTNVHVDERELADVRMSFPSGHASMAVYGALYTAFCLQLRLEVTFSHLLRPALQLALVLLALFCCVTRVTDSKHFPSDVIAGAAIGSCVSWLAFYKVGVKVIPGQSTEKSQRLPRATSIESEPQTPTPLLRPDRLVLTHNYRINMAPGSHENFVHKI